MPSCASIAPLKLSAAKSATALNAEPSASIATSPMRQKRTDDDVVAQDPETDVDVSHATAPFDLALSDHHRAQLRDLRQRQTAHVVERPAQSVAEFELDPLARGAGFPCSGAS